jgi:hypothetical protein
VTNKKEWGVNIAQIIILSFDMIRSTSFSEHFL